MLLTEAEAKTKACCKAMEWYQGKIMTAPCIASECMSWRWRTPADPEAVLTHGFCGLAGDPNPMFVVP